MIYILYFFRRDFICQQIADHVREKLWTEDILSKQPQYWGAYRHLSESSETQALRQKLKIKLAREQMAKGTGASIEWVEPIYHREPGEMNQVDWQYISVHVSHSGHHKTGSFWFSSWRSLLRPILHSIATARAALHCNWHNFVSHQSIEITPGPYTTYTSIQTHRGAASRFRSTTG
jgi:hypothetical protein